MNASPIIVRGTLRSDGTLELDDPPSLPAGPVEVVLRPLSSTGPAGEDWWQYLQRVRGEAEAGGGPYLSQREIDSGREEFRKGDERIDRLRQSDTEQADENPEP